MRYIEFFTELDKKTIRKAHKTADKILDKPKAKSNIAKWAKDKGMDPEGAVYAIATNMAKKKKRKSVKEGSIKLPAHRLKDMILDMIKDLDSKNDTVKLAKIARLLGKEVFYNKDKVVLQDPDFDFYAKENIDQLAQIYEKWSAKYKRSINCNNPKGFSQKAHCASRKK